MPANHLVQPERLLHIEELLQTQSRLSVADLSRKLGVSPVTIRGDLTELERRGRIVRIHGGAMAANRTAPEIEYQQRARLEHAAKSRIGQEAATLVRDGDSIFIDASTTALELARAVRERRELTVITTGLRTAQDLVVSPNVTVIMPGGVIRRESFALVGMWSADLLQRFNVGRAFMGARGFTLEEGLTDVHPDEVSIKRAIVDSAKEVIALIDHTKWNQVALGSFCASKELSTIISDRDAPPAMVEQARNLGIKVVLV